MATIDRWHKWVVRTHESRPGHTELDVLDRRSGRPRSASRSVSHGDPPSPSSLDDAAHRLATRWKNARRAGEQTGWPTDRLRELDAAIAGIEHSDAAAFVIVQSIDGTRVEEALTSEVATTSVSVDSSPRLLTILDSRQRTLPHIVVVTDRVGADIVTFDRGAVTATSEVEGSGSTSIAVIQVDGHDADTNSELRTPGNTTPTRSWRPYSTPLNTQTRYSSQWLATSARQPWWRAACANRPKPPLSHWTAETGTVSRTRSSAWSLTSTPDYSARPSNASATPPVPTTPAKVSPSSPPCEKVGVDTLLAHDVTDYHSGSIERDEGTVEQPTDRLVDRAVSQALHTAASLVVVRTLQNCRTASPPHCAGERSVMSPHDHLGPSPLASREMVEVVEGSTCRGWTGCRVVLGREYPASSAPVRSRRRRLRASHVRRSRARLHRRRTELAPGARCRDLRNQFDP